MKSEQAMWMVVALAVLAAGCQYRGTPKPQRLTAPYGDRQVWAVAPLRNESGSLHADGLKAADKLAQRLETVIGVDTLPVNRVLVAMQALEMSAVSTREDVSKLREVMDVDAIIVGSITAYDPYAPPKLGLIIELYFNPRRESAQATDLRKLVRAPTGDKTQPAAQNRPGPPVSVVSGFYDASDPGIHQQLVSYAEQHDDAVTDGPAQGWRLYQIDMDLYTEFVTYLVSRQLLRVEQDRLAPPMLAVEPAS
jgi:hypothetical protein